MNVVQVKRYRAPLDVAHALFMDIGKSFSRFLMKFEHEDDIHLTEILAPGDSRASSQEMSKAKKDEI